MPITTFAPRAMNTLSMLQHQPESLAAGSTATRVQAAFAHLCSVGAATNFLTTFLLTIGNPRIARHLCNMASLEQARELGTPSHNTAP